MKLIKVLTAALSATLLVAMSAQAAEKEKTIYTFKHKISHGSYPEGGLFSDPSGNLYGLTETGLLFELSPGGSNGWNYRDLLQSDCGTATGPFVQDHAGNFYVGDYSGDICEYSPNDAGGWSSSIIYALNSVGGVGPSNLLIDAAGNLYGVNGTTEANGFGYVFELSPSSGGWTLSVLFEFNGSDGNASSPSGGGLIMDASGNLYGATYSGGTSEKCGSKCGVVFKLSNTSGVWSETVLHNFNGADGARPDATLLMDAAGNLYGTTAGGGKAGFGVVFEISAASGEAHVLHNFSNKNGDGAIPQGVVMDATGNLYGTTAIGGSRGDCQVGSLQAGCGTAFELSPIGNGWKESLLHEFSGLNDGGIPSGLTFGAGGNLYGDTPAGGSLSQGVVFEVVH
jgi:uncharacterized repeat protein (TIGR03803 family)